MPLQKTSKISAYRLKYLGLGLVGEGRIEVGLGLGLKQKVKYQCLMYAHNCIFKSTACPICSTAVLSMAHLGLQNLLCVVETELLI